jgi:hypothetical protein
LSDPNHFPPNRKSRIHFGRFSMPIPSSRPLRIMVGLALCAGGLLGFLPILGFWMLPLGLLVLSIDLARCVDSGGAWRSGGAGANKSSAALSKKRGPDLHRALRHWVMVGCLQGKTRASCPYKVKIWLTSELVLDLTANES